MDIKITTIFDNFFRYQLDMEDIAAWFKKKELNSFQKVLIYLIAYSARDVVFGLDDRITTADNTILLEFQKALAYHICRINNTLP